MARKNRDGEGRKTDNNKTGEKAWGEARGDEWLETKCTLKNGSRWTNFFDGWHLITVLDATIYDSFLLIIFFFFQFLEKKEDFDEISPEILAARYDRRNIRATPKSLRRRTTSIRTSLRSSPKILRTNSSIPPKRRNDFVFFFFPLLLDGRLHPLLHARLALHTG